jgi:hypothetical protein
MIKRGTKQVTLLRFLLAKLAYGSEVEGLSTEEFLVLFELNYLVSESQDPNLLKKWEESLKRIQPIFQELAKVQTFPVILTEESRRHIERLLQDDPILPKPSAYYGLMGNRQLRTSFCVKFENPWPQRLPPKRFIGVGYKDKGNCRQPELDGSPSWQRVATVVSNQEREAEEASKSLSSPKEE